MSFETELLPLLNRPRFALSWWDREQDRRDAQAMCVYVRLRAAVTTYARMMILAGLAGGRP